MVGKTERKLTKALESTLLGGRVLKGENIMVSHSQMTLILTMMKTRSKDCIPNIKQAVSRISLPERISLQWQLSNFLDPKKKNRSRTIVEIREQVWAHTIY